MAAPIEFHRATGRRPIRRCWTFPNDDGHPMDESRVRKVFKQALKRAQLPEFRLYDLRHTYASLLLAAGAPITYVSAQLGHANPTTTLRYYARWIPSRGRRWVDLLDPCRGVSRDSGRAGGSKTGTNVEPKTRIGRSRDSGSARF